MTTVEDRYRLMEAEAEDRQRRRAKRQPMILIAVVNTLVLATGLTATVDLQRLRTPGGTALRWTEATLFGGCEDYLSYSVPVAPDPRTTTQLCRDLRAATAMARDNAISIGLTRGQVRRSGATAEVTVTVTRAAKPTAVVLHLRQIDGRWKVVRDTSACALGCP